jgi:hypothetical protein
MKPRPSLKRLEPGYVPPKTRNLRIVTTINLKVIWKGSKSSSVSAIRDISKDLEGPYGAALIQRLAMF